MIRRKDRKADHEAIAQFIDAAAATGVTVPAVAEHMQWSREEAASVLRAMYQQGKIALAGRRPTTYRSIEADARVLKLPQEQRAMMLKIPGVKELFTSILWDSDPESGIGHGAIAAEKYLWIAYHVQQREEVSA